MAESGETLSDRELAVLECLVDGSTNREIAQSLHISPNTVKVHLRNIFTKLDVNSRTEATAVALQKGLLSLPGLETTDEETDESGQPAKPDPITSGVLYRQLPVTTYQSTQPIAATERSHRWRTLSLALGGLLILVLLALVAIQFFSGDILGRGGQTPIEEQIGDTRWYKSANLPRPTTNMALATVGLNLYQIGGEVSAGVVNLVNIYETDSGQWRSGATKPTAVADASAAVLFGEIFVIGGRLADGQPTAIVEAYSPTNNAWRQVPPWPKPTGATAPLPLSIEAA
jgi:DNA-binding CsgD family transcriptional regulator